MTICEMARRLLRYSDTALRLRRYAGQAEKDLADGACAILEGICCRLLDRDGRHRPAPIPPAVRGLLAELWADESLRLLGVVSDYSQDHAILPSPPPPATAPAPAPAPSWRRPAIPWQVVVFDDHEAAVAADLPAVAGLVAQELTPAARQEIAQRLRALADALVR